jgi:ADP-ribose pyrophosphatase
MSKPIVRPQGTQPIPANAKKVFSGVIFDAYQWEQPLFNGRTATFEKLRRADTVVVLPILPDGRILLSEQEQPGKPPYLAAFGGRIEAGEDVELAALRELREESGYEAGQLELWMTEQPLSKVDWVVYTFIARDLKPIGGQELDGGEKVTLRPVSFEEFLRLASSPDFSEPEITLAVLRARCDADLMADLRHRLSP